jgi:GNAT superfamily N-acetyltransferase
MVESDSYVIRRFQPGDRDRYLSLHEVVFGTRPSEAWFDWKYRDNPYADAVPIVVAEHDGELVGARSFFALPLRAGGERFRARQACDTMVHPDHRRKGVFTRMTERALSLLARADPVLSFNFPNEKTLAGNLKLGWHYVEQLPVRYRIQPAATDAGSMPSPLSPVLTAGVRAHNRLRDATAPRSPDVSVTSPSTLPVETLATLAERGSVGGVHVPRSRRFYRWRYDRPDRAYEAFLARRDGDPVAAVVATQGDGDGRVLEFVPRTDKDPAVASALLGAVVHRYDEASLLTTLADDVDPSVLRARGFYSGRRWPLSRVVGKRHFVVRPFGPGDPDWHLQALDVRRPENWTLGFGDFDVY